jgi:hypothetical protein|tara:strand:+ start:7026 stop:7277 length:252 start_codon:yes stop_codon:yes gene_type:complete
MTRELFEKIFEETGGNWSGDNCFAGLKIIAKYTNNIVQAAEHDEVFSEYIDKLVENNITKEDVKSLALLNWSISEHGCLSCFV